MVSPTLPIIEASLARLRLPPRRASMARRGVGASREAAPRQRDARPQDLLELAEGDLPLHHPAQVALIEGGERASARGSSSRALRPPARSLRPRPRRTINL